MQRRAAAAYFAFFLVVGAAAFGYIGFAEANQRPQFDIEGTTIASEGSATIDGTTYQLGAIERSGGGHGSAGTLEAELTWTNESARQTATVENGSTLTYQGTTYEVNLSGDPNATSAQLREALNVTALLVEDSDVEDQLAEQDGTQYVVYADDDRLEPLAEYLPEPRTASLSVGDSLTYQGNDATVSAVGASAVTLSWTAPSERSADLVEGGNVTLANGQQYFSHYRGNDEVVLAPSDQFAQYAQTVDERDYFHERINGLWGVSMVSGVAALLLLSSAYLPNRG